MLNSALGGWTRGGGGVNAGASEGAALGTPIAKSGKVAGLPGVPASPGVCSNADLGTTGVVVDQPGARTLVAEVGKSYGLLTEVGGVAALKSFRVV